MMPFYIKGRVYRPTRKNFPKSAFSTFRYKKTSKGKGYLLIGKFKKPRRLVPGGKKRRWAVYEVLEPQ